MGGHLTVNGRGKGVVRPASGLRPEVLDNRSDVGGDCFRLGQPGQRLGEVTARPARLAGRRPHGQPGVVLAL